MSDIRREIAERHGFTHSERRAELDLCTHCDVQKCMSEYTAAVLEEVCSEFPDNDAYGQPYEWDSETVRIKVAGARYPREDEMKKCPVCDRRKCEGKPLCGLRYIARSPSVAYGGFHPQAVQTAKSAIRLILKLKRRTR